MHVPAHLGDPLGSADALDDIIDERDLPLVVPPGLKPDRANEDWTDGLLGTHLLVGATGAGKTQLAQIASRVNDLAGVAVLPAVEPPNSWVVEALAALGSGLESTEFWREVWRASCVSAFINTALIRCGGGTAQDGLLALLSRTDLAQSRSVRHPFAMLSSLERAACTNTKRVKPADYFTATPWNEILEEAMNLVPDCKGLYIIFDYLDESVSMSPTSWHAAQAGLVRLSLSEDPSFSQGISFCIAIRAATYSAVTAAQPKASKVGPRRLIKLAWTDEALLRLIAERLNSVRDLVQLHESNSVFGRTTGIEQISVPERLGRAEGIDKYVLRHCNATPRDAIAIGNALLRLSNGAALAGRAVQPEEVRAVVAEEAFVIGGELLQQAATELSVHYPSLARQNPMTGVRPIVRQMQEMLHGVDREVVELGVFRAAVADSMPGCDEQLLLDSLWRSRVFSIKSGSRWSTYSIDHSTAGRPGSLPEATPVRFHSSLIDYVGLIPDPEAYVSETSE